MTLIEQCDDSYAVPWWFSCIKNCSTVFLLLLCPQAVVQSIVIIVSVCLSVSLSEHWHILKTIHVRISPNLLWPWLGPLMAVQYIMYIRFCE